MVLTRVRQFYRALTSKITPTDEQFLSRYLNEQEYGLFKTMDLPTQQHCLNVAYSCIAFLETHPSVNPDLLIKAALLHDCGKKAGEIKTGHRVLIVLTYALWPALAKKLVQLGEKNKGGSLSRAFYIQAIHPQRGAKILKNLGLDPLVVDLVHNHHRSSPFPSPELSILQKADNAN